MPTIPLFKLRDSKRQDEILKSLKGLKEWHDRLNFYAFATTVLGVGDKYLPTKFAKPLSVSQVVNGWRKTVRLIQEGKAPRQLGIFIFVPFCKTKCFFCQYFSFPLASRSQLDIYTTSLLQEMNFFKRVFNGVKFNTLWFGGGTPSILEEEHLKSIFGTLYKLFSFTKDVQVTFECSCSSTNYQKLKLLHSLGVNRVTLGIQSLNDRVLKENNRLYQDRKLSLRLIKDAKRAGIETVNVDLMCGLPGDNINSFKKGLQEIISLKPEMIHINPFIPSFETDFFRRGESYLDSDVLLRTEEAQIGRDILLNSGYNRTGGAFFGFTRVEDATNRQEIGKVKQSSSFIGFGPSSNSHAFAQLDYTNVYFDRRWNKPVLPKYIGFKLDIKDEMRKYIISNLRSPILREDFRALFGRDIVKSFVQEIKELKKFGFVDINEERLVFNIKSRTEKLILAKHFLNPTYLRDIEKKFGARFNRNKDYSREINKLIDKSV